jgi:transposase
MNGGYSITAEHFRELLGVVRMTAGVPQYKISEYLNVSDNTMRRWKKNGVPRRISSIVARQLRRYLK